jgi:hypothetical protein
MELVDPSCQHQHAVSDSELGRHRPWEPGREEKMAVPLWQHPQTVSLSPPTPWGILFSDVGHGDLLVYPFAREFIIGARS